MVRPPSSMMAGIVMMAIALVWILLTPSTVTTSQPPAPRVLNPQMVKRIAPDDLSNHVESNDPPDEGTVDLYGNEVSDAVAKYRTDVTGSLYELHSPHTELPRLGSPKS
jgi:hypothetical protein